jgi:hypothetical protein
MAIMIDEIGRGSVAEVTERTMVAQLRKADIDVKADP